jgi:hypothetical protein
MTYEQSPIRIPSSQYAITRYNRRAGTTRQHCYNLDKKDGFSLELSPLLQVTEIHDRLRSLKAVLSSLGFDGRFIYTSKRQIVTDGDPFKDTFGRG